MIGWSGGVASGAVLGATSADDPGGGDLGDALYVQQRRIASDGTVSTSAEGSTTRTLDDGSAFSIDFDDLSDPDGRRYAIIGSVYQESEGADVVYELRLVEDQPHTLTQAQLDAAWLDTSPDASDADLAAFQAQRATAATMPELSIEIDSLAQDCARHGGSG